MVDQNQNNNEETPSQDGIENTLAGQTGENVPVESQPLSSAPDPSAQPGTTDSSSPADKEIPDELVIKANGDEEPSEEMPDSDAADETQHLAQLDEFLTDRHPTGDPAMTGGWYAAPDGSGLENHPPEEDTDEVIITHPANKPSQASGGWVDRPVHPQPAATEDAAEADSGDEGLTVPSFSRRRGPDSPTLPPSSGAMPPQVLPNRVEEIDRYATRVTPAAYGASRPPAPPAPTAPPKATVRSKAPKPRPAGKRRRGGCLVRGLITLLFIGVLVVVVAGAFAVYQYYNIAASLPSIEDLTSHASQFETTRILDRNGDVLYEILDPNAGRRTYIPLEEMSPYLIAVTIATEDKEYYNHPGFDVVAIARAMMQNYTGGSIVSGASTITQQLARMLLFSPEERFDRSIQRKMREAVLAAEITRQYSKEQILELYLNEIYYGNLAYGIEAASETYFNTTADKLTLAQASFLAG